jgi:hypothetical protein
MKIHAIVLKNQAVWKQRTEYIIITKSVWLIQRLVSRSHKLEYRCGEVAYFAK